MKENSKNEKKSYSSVPDPYEKIRQRWLLIEKNRIKREKYEIKEDNGWIKFGSIAGILISVIGYIMILVSRNVDAGGFYFLLVGGLIPAFFVGIGSGIRDSWNASLAAKIELEKNNEVVDENNQCTNSSVDTREEKVINGYRYKQGYEYTDSEIGYYFHLLTIGVCVFAIATLIIFGLYLFFSWIGSIDIAPTTIIIFLLMIIIYNQYNNYSRK